ncbi:hypothetical protein CF319_g5262 [Tilletia indica]|nr:hypothetical protein CF319_g5262 [Tilletia indica]
MTDSQPQQPTEKKSKKSTRSTKKQQQQQQTAGTQENSSDTSSMGVASSSTSFDIPITASGADTLDPSSSASPMNTDLAGVNGTNTPPASPSTNNNLSFQVNSPIPSVLGLQQHPAVAALTHAFEPVGYPVPSVVGTLPLTEADIQRLHGPAIAYLDKLSEFTYNESRHTSALQHIAETDTWPEDGPEWNDELRLAIQHRLLTAFRAYPLPGEVQPELHRAAPLIPLLLQRHHQQMQQAHFAQMGGAGGSLGPGQGQGSLPMTGQPDGNGNGTGGASVSGELPPNGNEGGLGLEPTGGADTSTSAAELAQAGLASRFVSASTLDAAASALSISPADLSSFYPSKRHLHHFHIVQQQQHLQQQQQLQQQLLLQNSQDQSTSASVAASAPSADGGEASSTEPANVGAGPSSGASQTLLNNSGRAVNATGPALYAPQIPLKHAEVMLYQLFSNSFSLEPASAAEEKKDAGKGGADASGTKSGEDVDATGKDKEGGGEIGKAKQDGESGTKSEVKETADSAAAGPSGASTTEAPTKSEEAMDTDTDADPAPPPAAAAAAAAEPSAVGPRPSAIPPSSSSQSVSSFGFAPNTSLLPINDSSTPLFIGSPPFTIQRLAELALEPRRHHASSTKFLHALERVLRVTARWDSVKEHDVAIAGPAGGAGAGETEGKDADGVSEAASLPATEGDASVLPVNSMADATQTMASPMPATAPTSNSTPTSTAERTIKRMRSERSLKGR